MICNMANESDDRNKKRQRLGSQDSEADTPSQVSLVELDNLVSGSDDHALMVLEEASFLPKAERVLRPRSRLSKTGSASLKEGFPVESPENVRSEKGEKFENDVCPEQGSRAADTLLSLHHVKGPITATAPAGNGGITLKISPQSASLSSDALKAGKQASGTDPLQHEALEGLKKYIRNQNGVLEEGWEAKIQRKNERVDKFYISPAKQLFRSRVEVARYLGVLKNSMTSARNLQPARRVLPANRTSERRKAALLLSGKLVRAHATRNAANSGGRILEGTQNLKTCFPRDDSETKNKKDILSIQAHSNYKILEPSDPLKSDKIESTMSADKLQRAKKKPPSEKLITQRCQDILRNIILTEKFGGLTSMLNHGPPLGSFEAALPFKAPTSVSGSLDLQLIALRLATGAYGQTPEMFSADLQQVWKNIDSAGHKLVALSKALSELTDNLYKEQVLSLFPGESEERVRPNCSCQGQSIESRQAVESSSQELNSPHSKKAIRRSKFIQRSNEQTKELVQLNSSQAIVSENACRKCGLKQGFDCVVCSLCNAGYHTYCITSISEGFPESGWHCPSCIPKTVIEDPGIVSTSQETREYNVRVLSLMPDQSADKTSETSREPLMVAIKGGVCKACGKDDESVLLCDACDAAYHMSCLTPVIERIPEGNWYCPECLESQENPGIPHEIGDIDGHHCAVCDRIGSNSLVSVEDEPPAELIVSYDKNICKVCEVEDGKKLTISCFGCEKLYHLSCVRPSIKKVPSGVWFCPSCLCRVCKVNVDDEKILLCDKCDEGYHTYCLSPPLTDIPEGLWFCPSCKSKTEVARITSSENAGLVSSENDQPLSEVSKRKRKSTEPRRSF